MWDAITDLVGYGVGVYLLKTMPGWIMLLLVGVITAGIAWRHRAADEWRFNPRFFRDAVLLVVLVVLLVLGVLVLLGVLEAG